MLTKAQKLRAKRKAQLGRPRKANAERFACGKIKPEWSKQESEKEAMAVALAARKRMHGLEARGALAGYTLGRLFLDGRITEQQREAGDDYDDGALLSFDGHSLSERQGPADRSRKRALGRAKRGSRVESEERGGEDDAA